MTEPFIGLRFLNLDGKPVLRLMTGGHQWQDIELTERRLASFVADGASVLASLIPNRPLR